MSNKEYTPDHWVIVEISSPTHGVVRKVLAGWSGGYLQGDSWKLSSGITIVTEHPHFYEIHNESGSIYWCNKHQERLGSYTSTVYKDFELHHLPDGVTMKVIDGHDLQLSGETPQASGDSTTDTVKEECAREQT